MADDFIVKGAEELAVITRHLKKIGDGDLRKELYAAINRAVKPLKADVKRSALDVLPRRGGLNQLVASSKLSSSTRGGGRNPGVRVTGRLAGHDLRAIDRGRLRHPVFGNRRVWVTQTVRPRFFSEPLEEGARTVRAELMDTLESIARRLVDG